MSDISQVALVSLRAESPAVDAICRQLERQVDEEEAAQVVAFTEMFFSKATDELLHERPGHKETRHRAPIVRVVWRVRLVGVGQGGRRDGRVVAARTGHAGVDAARRSGAPSRSS